MSEFRPPEIRNTDGAKKSYLASIESLGDAYNESSGDEQSPSSATNHSSSSSSSASSSRTAHKTGTMSNHQRTSEPITLSGSSSTSTLASLSTVVTSTSTTGGRRSAPTTPDVTSSSSSSSSLSSSSCCSYTPPLMTSTPVNTTGERIIEPLNNTNWTSSGDNCQHQMPINISSNLPQIGNGSPIVQMSGNLSHLDRVIIEIIETERAYVQNLREIIEGYLIYLRRHVTGRCKSAVKSKETPLDYESVDNLFGNLEEIYCFNSSFLCQLELCGLNAASISKCFVLAAQGFDVYTQYCTNYPKTVSLLTDLMKHKETSDLFKERQLALNHSLPLGSYLLKPVQRILKYHLLLQNIVKDNETDKRFNEKDSDDIRYALSVMTDIATHINEMKRKHEHAVRVQEIQSLLYGWEGQDLTTYGELVAEGAFRKVGAKAFRHLFLFDKMLLITKKKDENILCYKAHILCSNLMVIESIKGQPLCFQTIPFDQPRLQYTFQAKNHDQKREWCTQLKRLMLENYNVKIPSHAKQLVMALGQTSSNDKTSSVKKSTLSAPEYLERRKHERHSSRKNSATGGADSGGTYRGFKLKKSLKKFDLLNSNGVKRSRSASHDENACIASGKDVGERRASCDIDHKANDTPFSTEAAAAIEKVTDYIDDNSIKHDEISDLCGAYRKLSFRSKVNTGTDIDSNVGDNESGYFRSCTRYDRYDDSGISTTSSSSYNVPNNLRTGTPLSTGSSQLSMASSTFSEDSVMLMSRQMQPRLPIGIDCHNLAMVRRVQSFSMVRAKAALLQHTLSFRQAPMLEDCTLATRRRHNQCRFNTANSSILSISSSTQSRISSSSSLDDLSPTSPARWIRRQEKHFPIVCKKGGSLPRSFESKAFAELVELARKS